MTRASFHFAVFLIALAPSSSQAQYAFDNFEDAVYSTVEYGDNGGTGFGGLTYLNGTSGGVYAETGGALISGTRSLGVYASSGGQGLGRTLSTSLSSGTFKLDIRFNVDNSVAFSGFNLKTALGAIFGGNQLLSVGLTPGTGNNAIFLWRIG